MKLNTSIGISVAAKVKTRIVDKATGKILREQPWQSNLVFDRGLNALARDTGVDTACVPANLTSVCHIGSGTNPNSIASGAITFTQSGTTITASAGFFTSAMVGGIFKWSTGSGGNEVYITAFTDSTHVTVDTSATVAVPDIATVWQVQQTALQTQLFTSSTYQTVAGDNQTTRSGGAMTYQRTYVFTSQPSSYTVNEIGYSRVGGSNIFGRIVLGASDVVAPTNFYVVVIAVTLTYSPDAPTAVADVGTNIDTSGNAMIEFLNTVTASNMALNIVTSTGAISGNAVTLEGTGGAIFLPTADYTQNASIQGSGSLTWTAFGIATGLSWTKVSGVRGAMQITSTITTTTSGQTIRGVGITNGAGNVPVFDVDFTTNFTLPTGTFNPTITFRQTFGRTLTN